MASARQKGRNYRRKQTSNSSPEDSDREFHHTTPFRAVPSLAHLTSSSEDLGGDNISTPTLRKVILDGGEASEREAEGGRTGGGDEGGGGIGGIGGREADQEGGRSVDASPNGRLDSTGPSTRRGVPQNAAKRIESGVGYNMLKAMGWRENTGIGQSGNGIVDPILPTAKPNHLGIGFNLTAAHDAAQKEIRQIQKAKREERDLKVQEKLDKAEADEEEAIFMRESFVAVISTSYNENVSGSAAGLQGTSSKPPAKKPTEPGQCPHCKQRFDTKHALKSHVNARHARSLLAAKRESKNKKRLRREGGSKSNSSGRRQSARSLAPVSQDFSVYD